MKKIFLFSLLGLVGCAGTHMMSAKTYAPVEPEQVQVVFKEMPACDYEEIGLINTPYSWSSNSALKKARKKAAKIGADYIKVERVDTNEDNDAKIEAVAYKCIEYYE